MRFFADATERKWAEVTNPAGETKGEEQVTVAAAKQFLRDVLSAENLAILCGVGTTLSVTTEGGASPPTMEDLWSGVEKVGEGKFQEIIEKVRYGDPQVHDVELLLSKCQLALQFDPSLELEAFATDAEKAIVKACRFVSESSNLTVHETFLRKLTRRPIRRSRPKVFTTNYDLCFETAASRARFIAIDGFSHTLPQQFDGSYFAYDMVRRGETREAPDFVGGVFHLYKLHGSVDWSREGGGQVRRDPTAERPLIIYPRDSKYQLSYEQPFLEMVSRFQMALREPNTGLLIAGFGFRDRHLVEPILSAVRSNVSLKLVVVDPNAAEVPGLEAIRKLVELGDPRLGIIEGTFEDVVSFLPDVVAVSDEEAHHQRIERTL